MNEHNAQNGAKKGTRTNRARPYVAMVSVLDLADGDEPELVERLAGLAGNDGHEHGSRLVGHVVQGDLAGGAGGRGRLHSGRSGGCGGRGSGLRGFFAGVFGMVLRMQGCFLLCRKYRCVIFSK